MKISGVTAKLALKLFIIEVRLLVSFHSIAHIRRKIALGTLKSINLGVRPLVLPVISDHIRGVFALWTLETMVPVALVDQFVLLETRLEHGGELAAGTIELFGLRMVHLVAI